eukprot:TRINITY_DN54848_c0_g1_i1.p1 TRINITY_DN54848_c0_g1~~TRINITY_DN54848_c0_g1_i1.p1  ORF type:complete len:244 (-),score=62.85 TRINITY_DN54848_c0_g1_i1:42-737(-)
MAPKPEVIWEWNFLIASLRRRKTAVVYPNLHSCARTAPASASDEDVATALEAIAAWALKRVAGAAASAAVAPPVLVYGKSWGGARALQCCARLETAFAAGAPTRLAGLCLACPAVRPEDLVSVEVLSVPVLLAWARDDDVIPFDASEPLLAALRSRPRGGATVFSPQATGGHRVDHMAAHDEKFASKLEDWPDLALGPLAKVGAAVSLGGGADSKGSGVGKTSAFDLSGMM